MKHPAFDFTKVDRDFAELKAVIAELQEMWVNRHLLIREIQHARAVLDGEEFEFDETLYKVRPAGPKPVAISAGGDGDVSRVPVLSPAQKEVVG
jgi:hypothetical protein